MIDRRPRYRIHRTHTGSPVTGDGALSSIFPAAADALETPGWKSLSIVALLSGGAAPTALYELCERVSYMDGSGVEQSFYHAILSLPALSNQQSLQVPVYGGNVFFRLASVTGNPTAVTLLVAGAQQTQDPDHLLLNTEGAVKVDTEITATLDPSGLATQTTLAAVNAILGAAADAKVDTDAVGSISSKLRGAVSRLAELSLGLVSVVDAGNSSSALLLANATFTGTWKDITAYPSVIFSLFSDVAGHADGLKIQFSSDGVNVDTTVQRYYTADAVGAAQTYKVPKFAKYMRVVYRNGAAGQGTFRLQTILSGQTLNSTGPRPADVSLSICEPAYYTPVTNSGGAASDIQAATDAAVATYWQLEAGKTYILRIDPDVSVAGTGYTDYVVGTFKLGAVCANKYDGNFIERGERVKICVAVPTKLYLWNHAADGKASRYKLVRYDG